jgi:fatty acid amide hydrolase 2
LGVTNCSELCMWIESSNKVYGTSNNPYDVTRTVGGSSGGEGCIISTGGSIFGVGSDVGGSIRLPSFFNGIFGLKPTGGLVPNTGQFPITNGKGLRYLTTGPMCRRAEDLWPLLKIMMGPDGKDEKCRKDVKLGDPFAIDFTKLKVYNIETNGGWFMNVSEELLESQRKVARFLEEKGAKVYHNIKFEHLKHSFDIWASMMQDAGGPTFYEYLCNGSPKLIFWEFLKYLIGQSDHTLPALALCVFEQIPKYFTSRNAKILEIGKQLKKEIREQLGDDSIILYPSYPSVAPKHKRAMLNPFR